jgi:hypothetical protein
MINITEELLAELEQLAGKATPVEWNRKRSFGQLNIQDDNYMLGDDDAKFIATANPATILALLQHVRELKVDAERYRWLRNPDQDVALVLDKQTEYIDADDSVPGVGGYFKYEYRAGEELDAAIDAARSSTNS